MKKEEICELCGFRSARRNEENRGKFPVVSAYENGDEESGKLLAVRCAECDRIPYYLKEGNPNRVRRFNTDGIPVTRCVSHNYNFWSYGIGHLLELYEPDPGAEPLDYYRLTSFEIGFFVEEDVNLILLAYRFLSENWFRGSDSNGTETNDLHLKIYWEAAIIEYTLPP